MKTMMAETDVRRVDRKMLQGVENFPYSSRGNGLLEEMIDRAFGNPVIGPILCIGRNNDDFASRLELPGQSDDIIALDDFGAGEAKIGDHGLVAVLTQKILGLL
jgi:hypothetical protein